ncbi:PP2C family protein-serine/threonine phosphatase [Ornithinimicrobium sp. LYQ121]|uniref:PP2C family protein-serine/threonine phosphatase n=1 Tax=Ornithinimicrobium sp. LYQ121 TaxID=3378801 RepID=UPI00385375B2
MTTTPPPSPTPPAAPDASDNLDATPPGATTGDSEPEVTPLTPPDPVEAEPEVSPLTPPDPVEEEPEPFSDGPPPLPAPMLLLDGQLGDHPDPPAPSEEEVDHGTCSCGGAYDADGWCTECGARKPDPRHHVTDQPSPLLAGVCDRGIRHSDNEDAMALWADEESPGRFALVVCDGVTTATRSAEASLAAAEAAVGVLARSTSTSTEPRTDTDTDADAPSALVIAATAAAAAAVDQVGRDFPDAAPSCTYVAALVEDGRATVGSVGDSRAYWFPDDGEPLRLTSDDSMAEEQYRAGLDRATAEAGPLAHTITRWLGDDSPDQSPEVTDQDVSAPGWLLLCSDGLWNYASEPHDLRAVVRQEELRVGRDPLDLAQALVAWANGNGGADNITAALLRTGAGQDGTHG